MRSRMFKQGYEYAEQENEALICGCGFGPDPGLEPFDDPEWEAGYEYFWEKANER